MVICIEFNSNMKNSLIIAMLVALWDTLTKIAQKLEIEGRVAMKLKMTTLQPNIFLLVQN